jgi:deoxycytidine triphosphate deaminase
MILGPKKLLELVQEIKLVEGLSERELTNPEGAGFDLRLGEVYKISGDAFLGETERKTADIELVQEYKEGEKRTITIKPGDYFLVSTIEKVNMPLDLTANFKPRTTTFRSGLFLRTGNVAPGYQGKLTFGIKNEGPIEVTIEMGARFVHMQVEEVLGVGSQYRGQWQGGRVAATKKEKQV